MRIASRRIGPWTEPYVIAELGVNHDGSVDRALALVDAAATAGADAVKLQHFDARRLLSREARLAEYQVRAGATDCQDMLESLQLPVTALGRVAERARSAGMHAIVTVFSVELVDEAETVPWDAFKVASPDLVNRPLVERLAATGRPLLLSTGAATLDEVRATRRWLVPRPFVLMQCVSAYPAPDESAHLGALAALRAAAPEALGYSDHTTAVDTGALAVAAGARVLEKHLTWSREAAGPDHAASLDPAGLADYVRLARRAFAMLGGPDKQVLDIERDVRSAARQSVVSTRALAAGATIERGDLAIKRPGTGLPPGLLETIVGRRLIRAVEADMPIGEDDLA
ncbi:MAG: N-acetylneuraminate synthase family protein [Planctomycetota bacterium]